VSARIDAGKKYLGRAWVESEKAVELHSTVPYSRQSILDWTYILIGPRN